MSRVRNSHSNDHDHNETTPPRPTPPAPGPHQSGADDPHWQMPLDELAIQAALRAWRLKTLVHTLSLRWADDDGDIRQLLEALHDLLEPLCDQLAALQDKPRQNFRYAGG